MEFSTEIQKFLQEPNFMVLGTIRQDATIQMSVLWFQYTNNTFVVSTTTSRAKYKNITRNPHVTFVIIDSSNGYKFIQVRGTATISKEGAHELIDNLSEHYTGSKPYAGDPDHKEDRVVITITPHDYTSMGF